jgi:hypothetical protein
MEDELLVFFVEDQQQQLKSQNLKKKPKPKYPRTDCRNQDYILYK